MTYKIIESLPDNLKNNIIAIDAGRLNGRDVLRVMFAGLISEQDKNNINKKYFVGAGVATYKHAPEVKHSYIYIG